MNKRLFKHISATFAVVFTAACVLVFAGCSSSAKRYDMMGYFGTYSSFVVGNYNEVSENADSAAKEIEALLSAVESAIGATVDDSDVARFNAAGAGEKLEITRITYEVMSLAAEMYEKTDGYYNPAVGNLVDLWGFTPRFDDPDYAPSEPYDRPAGEPLPDEKYIEAFSSDGITDFGAVELIKDNGRYYAVKPNATVTVEKTYSMNIDLGGIGKGYAADECAKILSKYGLKKSYVSIGTSSLYLAESEKTAKGAPNKNMYEVKLTHPRESKEYLSVYACNVAASTSGDYEKFFIYDGVRYSHLINPFDGRPTDSGFVTGSVFGESAAEGDALTTALAVMEKQAAISYASESGYKYALLYEENGGYALYTNMDESEYALHDGRIEEIREYSID